MKKLFFSISATVLAVSAVVASTKASDQDNFFRDIRPAHWSWNGSDLQTIEQIFTKIQKADGEREFAQYPDTILKYGPGNWTFEFEKIGDRYIERGEQEQEKGLNGSASFYFSKAASYYAIAKYPHKPDNVEQQLVYAKNIDAVARSWKVLGKPFHQIEAVFEGKDVDGLLYLPSDKAPKDGWPLVIATNGIDVYKGEFFSLANMLASRGIAFFATDLMGTGTNGAIKLRPESDQLISFFMDELSKRQDIDQNKLGFMGVSFGGNTAARIAFTEEQRLSAVVNMCGPIHSVFMAQEEDITKIAPMYLEALKDRAQLRTASNKEVAAFLKGFSLINQGLVGEGKKKTSVPLLNVNAKNDPVAPQYDMELIDSASINSTLIYSGKDDHCPQDRFTVMPQVVDFFSKHLQ